jgi:hypothetical protein
LRKYVLRSRRDEKLRSTVAVDMGKMLAMLKGRKCLEKHWDRKMITLLCDQLMNQLNWKILSSI